MTHLDTSFHDHEMNVGPCAWERWVDAAEALAGHSLDGDNSVAARLRGAADGYSLDDAFDAWRAGQSPAGYVRSLRRPAAA